MTPLADRLPAWSLYAAVAAIPTPWIAAELGWFVAEFGRQPWTVDGVLPTALSASHLSVADLLITLAGFATFYSVLFVIEVSLMVKFIRKGPYLDVAETEDLPVRGGMTVDVEIVREIYHEAWKDNWGFVPMDREEVRHAAKDMKSMVDPNFLLIAERDGEPIGFSMTTQDFNEALHPLNGKLLPFGWLKFLLAKRRISGCRTLLLGVKPEHRQRGVDVMLIHESVKYGLPRGYEAGLVDYARSGDRDRDYSHSVSYASILITSGQDH